mmetsp:Transcript_1209/g.2061  ORF Transcript_1209/g.2061 Transcript_1209/m.2061 type:complete len:105 (-) Transcript_1209:52-366(-)
MSIPSQSLKQTLQWIYSYDLGGQSIFNQRGQMEGFWNDCTSIICVFDVSSRKSLQNCITRAQAIQTVAGRSRTDDDKQMPCLLVANKIDLRDNVSFWWNDVKSY